MGWPRSRAYPARLARLLRFRYRTTCCRVTQVPWSRATLRPGRESSRLVVPGLLALVMRGAGSGQFPRLEPDLHGSVNSVRADLRPAARIAERVRAPALDHDHPAPGREGELPYVPGGRASALESGRHREWREALLGVSR